MVAHHTALQLKLPISRWIPGEGDKIEALDPLQAPHAVHLLLSADQAAMLLDPDGFDILPEIKECLFFSPPLSSHNGTGGFGRPVLISPNCPLCYLSRLSVGLPIVCLPITAL